MRLRVHHGFRCGVDARHMHLPMSMVFGADGSGRILYGIDWPKYTKRDRLGKFRRSAGGKARRIQLHSCTVLLTLVVYEQLGHPMVLLVLHAHRSTVHRLGNRQPAIILSYR